MKKFVFTLAALYNYKQVQEKQKQIECAEAREKLSELVNRETVLKQSLETATEGYRDSAKKETTVHALMAYSRYTKDLMDQIDQVAGEIVKAQKVLDEKQAELVGILREIKTLENLRQEQYRQYLKESEKEEERIIGDLVSFNTTVPDEDE